MGGHRPREEGPGERAPGDDPGRTVLVVDDEPVVRSWVLRVLELAAIPAAEARDGREALRLVADGRVRPAILLTDIDMPGMSGVELAARLAALRPGLRVVMMTGDPRRAAEARGHPSIVEAVLLKPMGGDELLAALRPDAPAPVA
jgi:CheY-like chemotaxis protein